MEKMVDLNPVELALIKKFKTREHLKKKHPQLYFKLLIGKLLDTHYPTSKRKNQMRRLALQRRYSYGKKTCSEIILEVLTEQDGGQLRFSDVFERVRALHPRALAQSIRGSIGQLLQKGDIVYVGNDKQIATAVWLASNPAQAGGTNVSPLPNEPGKGKHTALVSESVRAEADAS